MCIRDRGCGAAMESLLRTRVGMFSLADSLTLSEIEALAKSGEIAGHVIPPDAIFGDSPAQMCIRDRRL